MTDIVEQMIAIADASVREDGTDIPLGAQFRKGADTIVSLRRERDDARTEIARLRDCLRDRPNTFLIAHEDGDHERLTRVAAKAIDRAESAKAEVARLREALTELHRREHATLGQMLLDKSPGGQAASNWQGGKVNGIGVALNLILERIALETKP